MTVLSASFRLDTGGSVLELATPEGRAVISEPKLIFLERGFVVVGSPTGDEDKLDLVTSRYGPYPEDGVLDAREIQHTTTDAVAVELARRMFVGELAYGPVTLPRFQDADAQQWHRQGGTLVRGKKK